MHDAMKKSPVSLRPMAAEEGDYRLMQLWFGEPELQQWVWCDEKGEGTVSLSRIEEKYGERARNPKDVFPYFILLEGRPMGFIQYYFRDEASVGLDMWIGERASRGKGYGAAALAEMITLIRARHPGLREIFIDPEPGNIAAVKCYQKAGFRICGTMMDDDAECLLMLYPLPGEAESMEPG